MPLYDQHKRQIDYLRISVTDRCNLACHYCRPRSAFRLQPHSAILRYEEFLRAASVSAGLGISHVRVTGGEPLMRRGVLEFLAALRACKGISDVSVTTNGVLLEGMAEPLRAAGVERLNISLDSLDAEKFRRITGVDAWERVWRGINAAEAIGFHPVKINMVPVKGVNDEEIAEFAALTLERQLHVRFIEFMPIGSGDRWSRDKCVMSSDVRAVIEQRFGALERLPAGGSAGPSDNHRISGARGVIGFISPITKHFCASCRRLRLTADGKIRPCLLSDTEIDIRPALRSGCGDEELERLMRLALDVKPERHYVAEGTPACWQRSMSRIGG